MFGCPDAKMMFSFAVINSIAAITLETINNTTAEFLGTHIFKRKLAENFSWRFQKEF